MKNQTIPFHRIIEASPFYDGYLSILGDSLSDVVATTMSDLSLTRKQAYDAVSLMPSVRHAFGIKDHSPKPPNIGLLLASRFLSTKGRTFEIEPNLNFLLEQTDIGSKAPASVFKLPFESVCIHLSNGSLPFTLPNTSSDPYILTDIYINEINNDSFEEEARRRLGVKGVFQGYEIVYVSNDKKNEYKFHHSRFIIADQWHDTPLEEILIKQLTILTDIDAENGIITTNHDNYNTDFKLFTEHLTKCLMFINSQDVLLIEELEVENLKARLDNVREHKKKKIKSQIKRAFNRIYVKYGKDSSNYGAYQHHDGTKRGHWRRGHFRMQPYGMNRTKRKTIWVKPILVKGDPTKEISRKTYRVIK